MVETHQLLGALRRAALAATSEEIAAARTDAASLLEEAGWIDAAAAVRAVLPGASYEVTPHHSANIPVFVTLSPDEYEAATIIAFDPDAYIAPSAFSRSDPGGRPCLLPVDAMPERSWRKLARACSADRSADGATILRTFLAERSASAA